MDGCVSGSLDLAASLDHRVDITFLLDPIEAAHAACMGVVSGAMKLPGAKVADCLVETFGDDGDGIDEHMTEVCDELMKYQLELPEVLPAQCYSNDLFVADDWHVTPLAFLQLDAKLCANTTAGELQLAADVEEQFGGLLLGCACEEAPLDYIAKFSLGLSSSTGVARSTDGTGVVSSTGAAGPSSTGLAIDEVSSTGAVGAISSTGAASSSSTGLAIESGDPSPALTPLPTPAPTPLPTATLTAVPTMLLATDDSDQTTTPTPLPTADQATGEGVFTVEPTQMPEYVHATEEVSAAMLPGFSLASLTLLMLLLL